MTMKDILIGTLGSIVFAAFLFAWLVMSGSMGLADYPAVVCAIGVLIMFLSFFAFRPVYL